MECQTWQHRVYVWMVNLQQTSQMAIIIVLESSYAGPTATNFSCDPIRYVNIDPAFCFCWAYTLHWLISWKYEFWKDLTLIYKFIQELNWKYYTWLITLIILTELYYIITFPSVKNYHVLLYYHVYFSKYIQ